MQRNISLAVFLAVALVSCTAHEPVPKFEPSGQLVRLNQLGFAPGAAKVAVVPASDAESFTVIEAASGSAVMTGELPGAEQWAPAGESVRRADLSGLTTPGRYIVRVEGLPDSDPFSVASTHYHSLTKAALKAFYFNRAGIALEPQYAGPWARPAGHPDTDVRVHNSAASEDRPEGSKISAPKGWYDAGDYGKYVVNSGISTYTLLAALEHYPAYYKSLVVDIPESGNPIPDILDEALWNLEWMLQMQDPQDGGVYHKLTTKHFVGPVMPHDASGTRYVVQKGTAATLNFAAVMATAARVVGKYPDQYPGLDQRMLAAAEAAWEWARQNPDIAYQQPDDVNTGGYDDAEFADEFAWAAAELLITTSNLRYLQVLNPQETANAVPNWRQSLGLAWMSMAHHRDALAGVVDSQLIVDRVVSLADELLKVHRESAYEVSMEPQDFVWGSNGVAMNRAMMLLQAYKLTNQRPYLDAAQALLDYVLGRNPTGYSYVTGFGARPPQHIHHRQSHADDVADPVPGFLVGGPRGHQGDDCESYPSALPAKAYLDDWCSYSTNEVTINWNAPLVYVSGALTVTYNR